MTKTRDLADLGGGFIQTGTGAVQRSVESKLGDVVSVKDFGAVGNGVTNDAPAFQAALDTGFQVYVPYSSAGYLINSTLILTSGESLVGAGATTRLIAGSGINNGWFIEVRGSNTTVDSLLLDASGLVNGAGAIRVRTDLAGVENVKIHNLGTSGCNYAIKDETHGSNKLVALQLRECRFKLHRGPGVNLVRSVAYMTFTDVVIDYVGSASTNHVAYSFTNNEGMYLTNVDVTGGTVDGTTTSQDGFVFNNCVACWLVNCMADTVGGHGFTFTGGSRFCYVNNCVASLCGKYGFQVISSSADISFTQCMASGRLGLGYAPASQHGFFLKSCDRVLVTGARNRFLTGSSFFMDGGATAYMSNCSCFNASEYAINSTGSNILLATGFANILQATGNFNFSSSLMYAYGPIYNSGGSALTGLIGPGTI